MIYNHGYFDTNILVNVSLIKEVDLFYQKFTTIKICEQVKKELKGWDIAGFNYNHIYFDTDLKIKDGNIKVISLHDFKATEQQLIDYQIANIKNEMGNLGTNEDLGEIYSVCMAQIHEAPYFCTSDNKFITKYKERHFKDLHVVTFDDVLNELYEDSATQKSLKQFARSENNKMTSEFKKIKRNGNRNEISSVEEDAIYKLQELKKKLT